MNYRKLLAASLLCASLLASAAAAQVPTTPEEVFSRNLSPRDQMNSPFAPYKVIGNIYYVGSPILATFLISTPQGLILINSDFEATVPVIKANVEKLGFKFTDIKILLGSHAHGDHMEGDAMVKELSGAQVYAMAEDVPALQAMKPGGKPHPIDRIIHDGDTVTLGGTTLTAHLTPGHTKGCTTWTLKAEEGGKTYDVVIIGSAGVNPGVQLVNNKDYPNIADDFIHTFQTLRSLPCDVPLGSHPAMFGMKEKLAKLSAGGPNPFIDPEGYRIEIDINDAIFWRTLAAQRAKAGITN
ncbi:MAG TPA: subclass B3 metallo-beta-lactamase [Bryobacteraceae bacterium]|nr:subclass B3 metallo-beta-lactamase [Bryobacteraceae bacterium]